MKTLALLLLLASQSGIRSTTLCTGDNPLDCLPPPAICGDGIVHPSEACDDGNRVDGDGCSMDCKRNSVVAARYRFDRTGVLELPPGMPRPSFDCRLDKWSGEGNLVCDGTQPVTFTPSGGPTAGVPTYWRPGGGGAPGAGVGFDGVDDRFDGGDAGGDTGDRTGCVKFSRAAISATARVLLRKDGVFQVYLSSSGEAAYVQVYSASSNTNLAASGSVAIGASNVLCYSYDYVADGSSIIGINLNGVDTSVSTAVGPLAQNANPLRIGASGTGTNLFTGSISRVTHWSGWAATQAQRAALVRSQYAAQGSLGEPLTVSGPKTSAVLTRADGSPYVATVPANMPSITADGVQVYPARTSRVLYNQRSSANNANGGICGTGSTWGMAGTATCALSSEPAPDGSLTAERVSVGVTNANHIFQLISAGGFSANAMLAPSLWIKRVSTIGTLSMLNPQDPAKGRWNIDFAALPDRWTRVVSGATGVTVVAPFVASATGSAGVQFYTVSGAVQFDVARVWMVEGSIPGPDAEVQASPLSVAATSISGAHGIVGNRWCYSTTATADWSRSGIVALGLLGDALGDSSNSAFLYVNSGTVSFDLYNGASQARSITAGTLVAGERRLTFCNRDGTLSVAVDGTARTPTVTASGSGVWSAMPTTAFVGAVNPSSYLGGTIRSVMTCNTSVPEECQ